MPAVENITVELSLDAEDFERDIDRVIEKLERLAALMRETSDARNS